MGTKEIQTTLSDTCNLVLWYLLYSTALHVFNKSTTRFTDCTFQFYQQNQGPELASLLLLKTPDTEERFYVWKTYHRREDTWRQMIIQVPHVGAIPQQMAEQSRHFLRFIYSDSRSSPANQIKKCSKSESHKLGQDELYDVIYLMIFILFSFLTNCPSRPWIFFLWTFSITKNNC